MECFFNSGIWKSFGIPVISAVIGSWGANLMNYFLQKNLEKKKFILKQKQQLCAVVSSLKRVSEQIKIGGYITKDKDGRIDEGTLSNTFGQFLSTCDNASIFLSQTEQKALDDFQGAFIHYRFLAFNSVLFSNQKFTPTESEMEKAYNTVKTSSNNVLELFYIKD